MRDPELNLADPLDIRLARAGMKRFYPEDSVEVLGPQPTTPTTRHSWTTSTRRQRIVTRVTVSDELARLRLLPARMAAAARSDAADGVDDPLFIEEEEVPRIGARLKRKFQYARSSDGRSWLWIGRNKIAGSGEAASELRFDVAVKTTTLR